MITLSEVEYGRRMLALVKEEYETGNLKDQKKIADRLPHHRKQRTKNSHIIERNKILIMAVMIRNGRPMTNRQIKTEINSKRGKDDQINQYAISGAVISLENAKKLEKAGYVKSDGPRSDLVIEYQLVTK